MMSTIGMLVQVIGPYVVVGVLGWIVGRIRTARKRIGRISIPVATREDWNWTRAAIGVFTIVMYLAMSSWITNTRNDACQLAVADTMRDQAGAGQAAAGYGMRLNVLSDERSAAISELFAAPADRKDEAAAVYAARMADIQAEWNTIRAEQLALIDSWPPMPDRICD